MPNIKKVLSLNTAFGEVYSIQQYVIKFVSDLRHVGGFLRVLRFPPPIKWPPRYNWNIVESVVKHMTLIPFIYNSNNNVVFTLVDLC
jgi:hypothetical protein